LEKISRGNVYNQEYVHKNNIYCERCNKVYAYLIVYDREWEAHDLCIPCFEKWKVEEGWRELG
jgi:hypothetical protein